MGVVDVFGRRERALATRFIGFCAQTGRPGFTTTLDKPTLNGPLALIGESASENDRWLRRSQTGAAVARNSRNTVSSVFGFTASA